MSVAICRSDIAAGEPEGDVARLGPVRVAGGVAVRAAFSDGASRIVSIRERDGYKVRMPRRSEPPEAVIINTGGGIAAGDSIIQSFEVTDDAALTATTQAAERVYRSDDRTVARLDVTAVVGTDARFVWLPQETILYDRSRLHRTITVDMGDRAEVLIAEIVVFGRTAMGETIGSGQFRDAWRLRRNGRLWFAENVRIDDDTWGELGRPACHGGKLAMLTLLYLPPHPANAADRLQPVRDRLEAATFPCAASAWNGLLTVRALAPGTEPVKMLLAELAPLLTDRALPRVWWT